MKNEKRLIDANTLKEEISSLTMCVTGLRAGKGVLNEFMREYRNSVLRVIDEQATVQPAQRKRSQWKTHPIYNWGECDICGYWSSNGALYNFCPMCGTQMRGEPDNG